MNIQTLKIFFRNLKSNKLYYFINITGLVIAIASVLTILTYIINETSFNEFYKNSNDIYRIVANNYLAGDEYSSTRTMDGMADQLKSKYPEIQKSTRLFDFVNYFGDVFIKYGDSFIKEESFQLVDNEFVDIFTLPLLEGGFNSFKSSPNGVIMTKKTALKYFGSKNPIGETIELKYKLDQVKLSVFAVIKDFPGNSTIQTGLIGKINPIYKGLRNKNMSANYQTFILLRPETSATEFENKLPKEGDQTFNTKFKLQNIKDTYLNSSHFKDSPPEITGNSKNLYIFSLISILILLVACGNYIILSNICSMKRNKEIAIKKTLGLSGKSLFVSFLSESVMFALLSLPFALILSGLFISAIGKIYDIHLALILFLNWKFILGTIIILIITGILGGSYNAFYLSSLKPVKLFNNNFLPGRKKFYFSKALVIFQTVTFVILLFCISIIFKQTNFGIKKDIGYKKENLISINCRDTKLARSYKILKDTITYCPKIQSFSGAFSGLFTKPELVLIQNKAKEQGFSSFHFYVVDYNYIEAAGFKLIAGRSFSEIFHPETNRIIINETAAKEFNLANPIGQRIDNKEIIGLVKDFNISSLRENITPVIFEYLSDRNITQILIRTNGESNAIPYIKTLITNLVKDIPPDLTYISDKVLTLYKPEIQFITLVTLFTILIILISSMGLFGLSVFLNNQRLKELAIRKTFGANNNTIISILLKDYVIIILISNGLGLPIAYEIMKIWLANYSYHIEIKLSVFITVAIVSASIMIITVIYNIIKASNTYAIKLLKQE